MSRVRLKVCELKCLLNAIIDPGLMVKNTGGISTVHSSWSYIARLGAYLVFLQKL